ncbi:hypothetical protein BASA81_013771 [Batrachochytrium salamandrivorans]|nr:hypothetical protein BASA81_013771 [Batrachochytrium salamandrivorans]
MSFLSNSPSPILAVYGAKSDASSPTARLALLLEASQKLARLKTLAVSRDHSLPLKKLVEKRYEAYVPQVILKPDWPRKHQEEIPGALLVCYETETLNASGVQAALSLLESVRANVTTSGRTSLPVFLSVICTGKPNTTVLEDERQLTLSQLKRASATAPGTVRFGTVPSFSVLFATQDLGSSVSLPVQRLGGEIMSSLLEHYHMEIGRIKSLKPQQNYRVKARLEFKCAQLYEMRSLPSKALMHYQQAYQALSSLDFKQCAASDVLGAAEFIHYRMSHLRIQQQEPKLALSQLKTHLATMSPYRDEEWMSRQHVLFAGLIAASSSTVLSPQVLLTLDLVERERLTPAFHFSRAAMFASKSRALELYEKLFAGQKRSARREAVLLYYVAKQREGTGDVEGAKRDFARVLQPCKQDGWGKLHALLLAKAMPAQLDDRDACALALFPQNSLLALAKEHLLTGTHKVDKRVMQCWTDGKRALLACCCTALAADLVVERCHNIGLEQGQQAMVNGLLVVDKLPVAAGLLEVTVELSSPHAEKGATWLVPVAHCTSKQLSSKLPKSALLSPAGAASASSSTELLITGLPSQGAKWFIGETFTLTSLHAFRCQCDTLQVVAVSPGVFTVTALLGTAPHVAVIQCTNNSTAGAIMKQVSVEVAPALHVVHNNRRFVQIECLAPNETMLQCVASTNDLLLGAWRLGDRRTVLAPTAGPLSVELCRESGLAFTVPLPTAEPANNREEQELECRIEFNHQPVVSLGQEIEMRLMVTANVSTKVSVSTSIGADEEDFAVSGVLQQQHLHVFQGQQLEFAWRLVAVTLGPCVLPSVFVETSKGGRREIASKDGNCLVLVA